MKETNWIKRWNAWIAPTRLPGVWKKKGGGFLVRARVKDPMTGKLRNIRRVIDVETEREAFNWLEERKDQVRMTTGSEQLQKPRFADYAVRLKERKVKNRELRSPTAQERWKHTLKHLIGGTRGGDGAVVAGFGELPIDGIRASHLERWREGISGLISDRAYSPCTANGWLSILRVIMKAATREFELPRHPIEHVQDFDTSDHVTYTEEAPQSLTPEQVSKFLLLMRAHFPQHYAMSFLAFSTGLRPSSLRPLRRKGATPDVLWDEGRLLIRRSQTLGEDLLQTTKQGTRYSIDLPQEVFRILRWHVETQLTEVQLDSELLFPSDIGGYRAGSVLKKPFARVSEMIELGYRFTPRGMRRTFNDLARRAQVSDVVTRSISGHATEEMQRHYSTVWADEQVKGLGQVVHLMTASNDQGGGSLGGSQSSEVGLSNEKPAEDLSSTG